MNKVLFESYKNFYDYEIKKEFHNEFLLIYKNDISLIETIEFEHKLSVFKTDEIIRNLFTNYNLSKEEKISFLKFLKTAYFDGIKGMVEKIEKETDIIEIDNMLFMKVNEIVIDTKVFIKVNENIKDIFIKPINYIINELKDLEKNIKQSKFEVPQIELKATKGFYLKSPAQKNYLKDIHSSLIEYNYIDKETKLNEFKKLFSNADASDIKPINWIASIMLLNYLIKLLKIDLPAKEIKNKTIISFTNKGKELTLEQLINNKHSITKDTKNLESIFKYYPNN